MLVLTQTDPTTGEREGADLMSESSFAIDKSGAERRRGLRILQNRPIKVYEPTAARYFGGQTEDISSTGLRVELPASMSLRPGKMLNVHVGLNAAGQALANRRQMIPARVIWVTAGKGKSMRTQEAGIEFLANISAHLEAA